MILVTGGAGFIGSHLVEALIARGEKVRILDNLSTGRKENLEEITGGSFPDLESLPEGTFISLHEKVEFLFGDVGNLETCRQACQGINEIFHLAALGSVQRSVEDPIATHYANATGTLNILKAAGEEKVKRVIYASSSSVYGNISVNPEEVIPKLESLPPHPQSPYAATKLMGEEYCRIFADLYGLETVSLRYFNVFGPRQNPNSIYAAVVPKFIVALLSGEPPIIFGDGEQSRDFTYVTNVVEANLLAMKAEQASGTVFNIACGKRTSVNKLLNYLQEISGRQIAPKYMEARKGEVRHSLADIKLAQKELGYQVKVDLRIGLEKTWEWFQKKWPRAY
ncbi:MAG: SDR family oxidoreductase [Thermodesulfobacteriota bacterium]